MRNAIATFVVLLASASSPAQQDSRVLVPDEKTAIAIAVAVWAPIYGEEHIQRQQPIVATLNGDVWLVRGTLPGTMLGGAAEAQISRQNGRVLKISHGQ